MIETKARMAAEAIGEDISDRRGLKWEWAKVDTAIKDKEIYPAWERIISAHMGQGTCVMCAKGTHPVILHKGKLVHHIFGEAGYYPCTAENTPEPDAELGDEADRIIAYVSANWYKSGVVKRLREMLAHMGPQESPSGSEANKEGK